ncbi:MAG: HEAT repeat domain-containing protein [Candidatus Thermoplasmatota archaeon]|nr:HEAT repeat domain-containing protein [Candidatus Thermoplasmatota archaeon]
MAREYVARDPRTGKRIGSSNKRRSRGASGIASLAPSAGPWQALPTREIVPLALGGSQKVEIMKDGLKMTLGRVDAVKALHKVTENDSEKAYDALIGALDDDYPDVRIAALKCLPAFSLRKQGILFHCLSDRLLDEVESVRDEAMICLTKVAPMFPSGCEEILRREMRSKEKVRRENGFESLRLTAKEWPEVGCLHLDEIIREDDRDLRIRGSKILRTIAAKGGAEAWDLISWSLQDEEVAVRRNASKTLTTLADVEPRIAVILVEGSIAEDDKAIRSAVIKALKKLDMQSPRVVQMILKGAKDEDLEMRRACIGQISIIMSGQELREAAGDLLKNEKDPALRRRLKSLAMDPDFEGTEEQKNLKLAPAEKPSSELDELPIEQSPSLREDDKRRSGRPANEEGR